MLCGLTIEMGARTGMEPPDETTYENLHGRDYAPKDHCGTAPSPICASCPAIPTPRSTVST